MAGEPWPESAVTGVLLGTTVALGEAGDIPPPLPSSPSSPGSPTLVSLADGTSPRAAERLGSSLVRDSVQDKGEDY